MVVRPHLRLIRSSPLYFLAYPLFLSFNTGMKTMIAFITISFSLSAQEPCLSSYAWLDDCYVDLNAIHPAQALYGGYSIRHKAGKIEKKYAEGKLDKHLKKKSNPAVISPDEKFYILDGHHHHFALASANIPSRLKKSYLRIRADFRNKSEQEFQKYMTDNKYVYLKDENFNDISFDQLPAKITQLKDSAYRSLAWIALKREAYRKSDTPFAEFYWANFFKESGIKLTSANFSNEIEQALTQALTHARSSSAEHLPGYIGAIKPDLRPSTSSNENECSPKRIYEDREEGRSKFVEAFPYP